MKNLAISLAAAAMAIALTGCGSDSRPSPMVTFVARPNASSNSPQLFTLNLNKKVSTAVAIPIPTGAEYVSSNSTATAVVYSANDTNQNFSVFLMGKDGTAHQLTTGPDDWAPVFSPDAKSVAFTSGSAGNQIVTMNADGTSQQALYPVADTGFEEYYPAFSPDGKSLSFYIRMDCCGAQSHLRANNRSIFPLVNKGSKIKKNGNSPVGTPTVSGWYTMALTDTTPTLVYENNSWWGPANYSYDGTKLLITTYDGTEWNILSINLDGTGATPLTTGVVTETLAAVATKNLIVYNIINDTNSSWDIYTMDVTGANQTLITSTTGTDQNLIDTYWQED
jgi:Tol biopolymer transport system component